MSKFNINKTLTSGSYPTQGLQGHTSVNGNHHFLQSIFTSNIGMSNTCVILQTAPVEQYTQQNWDNIQNGLEYYTSNGMTPCSEFNVIKVDFRPKTNVKLNIHYAENGKLNDATIRYSTIIDANENFYRNYPVENQFFSVSIKNLSEDLPSIVSGSVSLSQYTQYSAPSQIKDSSNRFSLATRVRNGNDYNDDVILDRLQDVVQVDRLGVVDSIVALEQTIFNNDSHFNFTSNISTDIVAFSSSNFDTGSIIITGKSQEDTKITDIIELNGTSIVFGINNYKMIDNITTLDNFNNDGKITIARISNGEVMNVMDADAGRSTSLIYLCPDNTNSVCKSLNINGRSGLNTQTLLKLYKVVNNLRKQLVYQNNIKDGIINENIDIDIKLNSGEVLYGVLNSSNKTSNSGTSQYACKLNLIEYSINTEAI